MNEVMNIMEQTWIFMPNWKWLALTLALIGGFVLIPLSSWILNGIRTRLIKRFDEKQFSGFYLRQNIHRPLSLLLASAFWMTSIHLLNLADRPEKIIHGLLQIVMGLTIIRLAYMGVEAAGNQFKVIAAKTSNTLDDHLAPLVTRSMKLAVLIIGALLLMQNLGVNVVSLLAGLGIGGLAIALAAQDTFANLFGSITVIFDRPFQIGDIIKIGDAEGTVEAIGLRSTRLRSPTKTLISVPNSIMAKERIENLGQRTSRRCRHTLGVTYDTSPHQILAFIDHIRYVILQHPLTLKEDVTVTFNSFGDSSLNILVNFFVMTNVYAEEMSAQQEILIQIMQVAEHDGISFAFPTRTLEINSPLPNPVPAST